MRSARLIDLSYTLEPGVESRRLSVERIPIDQYSEMFPFYVPSADDPNYPMHRVQMVSHIGTHIETPFHYKMKGSDLAEVPLQQLCGEGLILDLRGAKPREILSLARVKKAARGLRRGDIVFCRTGYGRGDQTLKVGAGSERLHQAPYFSLEAIEWLIARGMKLFGVETEMEDLSAGCNVNHEALFTHNIPLIENLANLDQLRRKRVTVFVLPPKIRRLEGFPVRVVALEATRREGRPRSVARKS